MNTKNYFQEISAWPSHAHSILRAYVLGFLVSLLLTGVAYFITVQSAAPGISLYIALLVLACAQFAVQVICFLHLGSGHSSRERLIVLVCASVIVLILVSGSLWIMTHLNERMMMDPAAMQQYMDSQQGI
jgi:cytochrome o ubiquinol oxidase operon protein cyoD